MISHRFMARVGLALVLGALLVVMLTAVLMPAQPHHHSIAADPTPTPTPTQAPDGWGDPVGG